MLLTIIALYPQVFMECAFEDLVQLSTYSSGFQRMSCGISTATAQAFNQALTVTWIGWGLIIFCLAFFVSMYFYD